MRQRHRHVQVVGAGPQRRAEERHHETRVGGVHQRVTGVLDQQRRRRVLVACVQLDGAVAVPRGRRVLRAGQVVDGDDQFGERAAGRDPGECCADPPGPDEKDAHTGDPSLRFTNGARDQS